MVVPAHRNSRGLLDYTCSSTPERDGLLRLRPRWRRPWGGVMLRKLAWWYTAGFLGIFLICHTPGVSDAEGRLFGLFRIDPIDDFVHLLSGIAGALVAWRA